MLFITTATIPERSYKQNVADHQPAKFGKKVYQGDLLEATINLF